MATTKTKTQAKKKTVAAAAKTRPRKPTATKRLERGEGDARVFWEISQTPDPETKKGAVRIKIRHGRFLSDGRTTEKTYDDKATATVAYEKAIEQKRADGFSEPAPKEVIGGSSRKGTTARNPELETLIDEDPSDLSRYLIYADWLQQQGDPRGELIMAQHKLMTAPDSELEAVEHIEWKLFRDFGRELLGPLARHTLIRSGANSLRAFAWRCGFIRAVRWQSSSFNAQSFRAFVEHPSARFLEMVVTSVWSTANVCDVLRELAPKTFTTLSVSTRWSDTAMLDVIASHLPKLKRLWVPGALSVEDKKEVIAFESLEEIDFGFATAEAIAMLARVRWPQTLERVHLTLAGFDSLEREEMKAVMRTVMRTFPMTRRMTLRRWHVEGPQDELADAVLSAVKELPNALTELNLHLSLSKKPPNLLPLTSALPSTLSVNIPASAISDAYFRSDLANKVKSVTFVPGDPIERDREDINPFHHKGESPS